MAQPTYPGVYVEEIPSGVHTIAGVSTSVAAFIDFFPEGPMDEAVQIFGMTDFNRIFGGLNKDSEASYAIAQFFLNGGSEAYVIRVASASVASPLQAAAVRVLAQDETTAVFDVVAANPGEWGNSLRVDIDYNTDDPTQHFNMYVTRYSSADADASPGVSEKYLNLSIVAADSNFIEKVVNEKSALVRVTNIATGNLPAATGTMSVRISLSAGEFDGLSEAEISVTIGATNKNVVLDEWLTGTITSLVQLRSKLETAIRNADPTNPSFSGATVEYIAIGGSTNDGHFIVHSGKSSESYNPNELVVIDDSTVTADTSATDVLKISTAVSVENAQEYQLGRPGAAGNAGAAQPLANTDGVGGDGLLPDAAALVGSKGSDPFTGMYALDYVDLFNILCIPYAAELTGAGELFSVYSAAKIYCQEKRAFLIVDIPKTTNTVADMKDWMDANNGLRGKNSAIYFPRLSMSDSKDEFRIRSFAASGTMAGVYARIDNSRGVWKAPAGTEAKLEGVLKLDAKLTDAQNGTLNPLGINCGRSFPIYGNISWGARTMDGSDAAGSEWKYIPIRRLALFLEESLFRGTKWVVFEPNDEPLWAKIRLNINAFMMGLFRQSAFQGSSPSDAYYVKCDAETTTQADRNLGIVNIEIGFAPLKPAEFVILKIQQMAGDL